MASSAIGVALSGGVPQVKNVSTLTLPLRVLIHGTPKVLIHGVPIYTVGHGIVIRFMCTTFLKRRV